MTFRELTNGFCVVVCSFLYIMQKRKDFLVKLCPTFVQQKKEIIMLETPLIKGFQGFSNEWVSLPSCPPF